ncbi:DiGeorge syndrome critical region protein 14 [Lobosporangium transversale]|nr:DiGeorge syndrome critical region protein 14 [Lobosporangium transversale]
MMDTPAVRTLRKQNAELGAGDDQKKVIDTSLSLDEFQARYTSEDNASFIEIVEKINSQKREKYRWLYEQEKKHQKLIEGENKSEQKLLLQNGETNAEAADDNSQRSTSSLALISADKKSATIPTWEYKAKNTLMYFPEGLGTNLDLGSTRAAPKEVVHPLKMNDTDSPKVRGFSFVSSTPSPSMSQLGDDPDLMTWGTIEDEPLLISSGVTDSGPSPFKVPPTPRRELLAQKLTERASKRIRETPSLRDKVYTSPSMSALSQYHNSIGGSTPTPKFNSPYHAVARGTPGRTPGSSKSRPIFNRIASPNPRIRTEMLSPAAQNLLQRARGNGSRGADQQLRSSYGNNSPIASAGRRHGSVTPSPLHRQH